MKDYHHYVPLLRLKASELDALRGLKPETKARITPLIEVLPNNDEKKTFSKYIQARLTKLTDTCKDLPFYVDLALLHPTPAEFDLTFILLEDTFSSGELKYVPVVTLQTPEFNSEVQHLEQKLYSKCYGKNLQTPLLPGAGPDCCSSC
jgi:hypothetical protein